MIFASVPYTKSISINKNIYKYYDHLNKYIRKLNGIAEGDITYYKMNEEDYIFKLETVAVGLSNIINRKTIPNKPLIHINTENTIREKTKGGDVVRENILNVSMECISLEDDATLCNENSRANRTLRQEIETSEKEETGIFYQSIYINDQEITKNNEIFFYIHDYSN